MIFVFDTETYPIKPGLQAPPIVCGQYDTDGEQQTIELAKTFRATIRNALKSSTLVAHNAAYDMACVCASYPEMIPLVFQAYSEDRITCTSIRERLIRIGQGTMFRMRKRSLLDVAERYKIDHDYKQKDGHKEEYWRTRYCQLESLPVSEWPADAVRYAKEDARVTRLVYLEQQKVAPALLVDQFRQSRADFWLYLSTCHGMRVDQRYVSEITKKLEEEYTQTRSRLLGYGLVRPDGSRSVKKATARMRQACIDTNLDIPITKTGKEKLAKELISQEEAQLNYVSLDADACRATGDQPLVDYARFGSLKTLRARAQTLSKADNMPIQPRFDVLKETGRTSSSKGSTKPGRAVMAWGDQVQNVNREPGLRECYKPRTGKLFVSCDWASAELHTLAQACLYMGIDSNLARVLNSGRDAHMSFGAAMKGWDYQQALDALQGKESPIDKTAAKEARQMAKAGNFGFPGGLGVAKFRLYASKTYGVVLSERQAYELKSAWFGFYPEMRTYFNRINELIKSQQPLVHHISGRLRGDIRYTSACNSFFQGLAADMAKDCGFDVAKQCYSDASSPLFGSRIVNFIHDEFILEVDENKAHEAATHLNMTMDNFGKKWCPGVPVKAEPAVSRRWRKGAEPVYRNNRLIPWEDREVDTESIINCLKDEESLIRLSWLLGLEEDRLSECKQAVYKA